MQLLISPEQIARRLDELTREIAQKVSRDREILVLVVMDGALMLAADLVRRLPHAVCLAFIKASSYRAGITSGELMLDREGVPEVQGKDVLLIDDILDSGKTLKAIHSLLIAGKPASLNTLVLLRKELQNPEFDADWVGFTVPDRFVVGYGMDWAGHLRHLPGVHFLDAEDLEKGPRLVVSQLSREICP